MSRRSRAARKAGWREWLQWALASAVGSGLGVGLAWEVALALYGGVYSEQGGGIRIRLDLTGALLFYTVAGLIVGSLIAPVLFHNGFNVAQSFV